MLFEMTVYRHFLNDRYGHISKILAPRYGFPEISLSWWWIPQDMDVRSPIRWIAFNSTIGAS